MTSPALLALPGTRRVATSPATRPSAEEAALAAALRAHPAPLRAAIAAAMRETRLAADTTDRHRAALWRIGATVAGPLLSGFVLWVQAEARRQGIARLHYVSRDGQILHRIAGALPVAGVERRYLLGSRQAWHLPALEHADADALSFLGDPGGRESLRRLLARAELTPEAIAPALARQGLHDPDAPPPTGGMAALLRDAEVAAALRAAAAERRRHALSYLRGAGLFDGTPQAMVDLGWHGRLQRSLDRLLRLGAAPGEAPRVSGFFLALLSRPEGIAAGAAHAFIEDPRFLARLNPVLLEIFCAADHGTVRRYLPDPRAGARAELAAMRDGPVLDWGLGALQGGILAFATRLADAMARQPAEPAGAWIAALRDGGAAAYDRFRRDPAPADAEAFGSFPHADGQTHEALEDCAPAVGAGARLMIALGLTPPGYAGHWPEGSLRRGGGALGATLAAARRARHRLSG